MDARPQSDFIPARDDVRLLHSRPQRAEAAGRCAHVVGQVFIRDIRQAVHDKGSGQLEGADITQVDVLARAVLGAGSTAWMTALVPHLLAIHADLRGHRIDRRTPREQRHRMRRSPIVLQRPQQRLRIRKVGARCRRHESAGIHIFEIEGPECRSAARTVAPAVLRDQRVLEEHSVLIVNALSGVACNRVRIEQRLVRVGVHACTLYSSVARNRAEPDEPTKIVEDTAADHRLIVDEGAVLDFAGAGHEHAPSVERQVSRKVDIVDVVVRRRDEKASTGAFRVVIVDPAAKQSEGATAHPQPTAVLARLVPKDLAVLDSELCVEAVTDDPPAVVRVGCRVGRGLIVEDAASRDREVSPVEDAPGGGRAATADLHFDELNRRRARLEIHEHSAFLRLQERRPTPHRHPNELHLIGGIVNLEESITGGDARTVDDRVSSGAALNRHGTDDVEISGQRLILIVARREVDDMDAGKDLDDVGDDPASRVAAVDRRIGVGAAQGLPERAGPILRIGVIDEVSGPDRCCPRRRWQ